MTRQTRILQNTALTLLVSATLFCLPQTAQSEEKQQPPACGIEYEIIFDLKTPENGAYSVWDTVWGSQDEKERFETGIALENLETLVAGQRIRKPPASNQLIIARTRKNGRVRWHKTHEIKNLSNIVKMMRTPEGLMILANRNTPKTGHNSIWIGFFDENGELKSHTDITDKNAALTAYDIIPLHSSKQTGYRLAASQTAISEPQKTQSVATLYTLDDKGRTVSKRALVMGLENRINSLKPLKDGGVLGTGYSYDPDGRKTGWIIRLDQKNNIVWQRQYPRGAGAQFVAGAPLLKDAFVAVGTASPLIQDGKRAGWITVVSRKNGEILWQRYITGETELFGQDLLVSKNGIISALLNAKKTENSIQKDHVLLVKLNPRGVFFGNETYFNDEGATGYQLIPGPNRERIIIGQTTTLYKNKIENPEKGSTETLSKRSPDGWISAAVPVDRYDDPCAPKPYKVP